MHTEDHALEVGRGAGFLRGTQGHGTRLRQRWHTPPSAGPADRWGGICGGAVGAREEVTDPEWQPCWCHKLSARELLFSTNQY